jgi:hypothetical protein
MSFIELLYILGIFFSWFDGIQQIFNSVNHNWIVFKFKFGLMDQSSFSINFVLFIISFNLQVKLSLVFSVFRLWNGSSIFPFLKNLGIPSNNCISLCSNQVLIFGTNSCCLSSFCFANFFSDSGYIKSILISSILLICQPDVLFSGVILSSCDVSELFHSQV